jgi:hypothetical protein
LKRGNYTRGEKKAIINDVGENIPKPIRWW